METEKMSRDKAKLQIRFDMSTPKQQEEFKKKKIAQSKDRYHEDVVYRADAQITSAINNGKGKATEAEHYDLLLALLPIRGEDTCYYCGSPRGSDGNVDLSADRRNSDKTYMESYRDEELVPACCWCNRAKSDLHEASFWQLAKNVVDFQDHGIAATIAVLPRMAKLKWIDFLRDSGYVDRPVYLTELEFEVKRDAPCHHCGFMDPIYGGGIDRLYNDPFYNNDSSVSCCWPCNQAKKNHPAEHYYHKCHIIVGYHDL